MARFRTRVILSLLFVFTGCNGECIRHSDCPADKTCFYGECVSGSEEQDADTPEKRPDAGSTSSTGGTNSQTDTGSETSSTNEQETGTQNSQTRTDTSGQAPGTQDTALSDTEMETGIDNLSTDTTFGSGNDTSLMDDDTDTAHATGDDTDTQEIPTGDGGTYDDAGAFIDAGDAGQVDGSPLE